MAESILFGIAQEVLKKLGSSAITELYSARSYKTELNKLKNTISTLKDVLLDAEDRQADSRAIRGWLERLATVIYAADDLFDELNVVAARKELMGGQKFTRKVRTFFSHSNQVALPFKISQNIKKIREQLDDIVKDGNEFHFMQSSAERKIVMVRRDQTISYVDENEVVGRDDDKKAIVDMLLMSSSTGHEHGHDEEVSVISIVGMGGMGKTTLAQLIYNDPQVEKSFDLRLWVCVSDVFDIKTIIDKLLKSATTRETPNLELDQLQGLWRKEVNNKNYLLVLDDVWNEKREEWLKVRELLKIGGRGSKILVTTRSTKVAEIMGTSSPYELQKLSEEKSLSLFEKMALKPGEALQKPELVEIGKEIVKKCGHVPLAIQTIGCLLYGKEKSKWLSIKDTSLAKIHENQSGIMSILRLSYHHLWSPLKNCFAYCALFPKDYVFKRHMLIDLWIAEGYVVPCSDDDQSLDEAAEEYFQMLLQRGFFQNIERNSLEVIESCKMHDFMHDLAQEVAGVKCKVAKSDDKDFDEKIVHLSLAYQLTTSWEILASMLNMKLLRTLLLPEQIKLYGSSFSISISQQLVKRFTSLRVLDLDSVGLKSLPGSIGKLIHLRYLNLSYTPIEKLPDSITDLWNLQTLRLYGCRQLRTLPADMWKLTNLRSLDVKYCSNLTHMPSRLGGLTSLSSLPRFIVNVEHDEAKSRFEPTAKLSDLKNLNNLRGRLEIIIEGRSESSMSEAREADLSSKDGVTELTILFPFSDSDGEGSDCKHDDDVLEGLEPPSNVKCLQIYRYEGQKLPSWTRMDNTCTTLSNVVEIRLDRWIRCQQLPAFSQLPLLKRLRLMKMESVEYIESGVLSGVLSSTSSKSGEMNTRFFPSLEELELYDMENFKGWWNEAEEIVDENNDRNEVARQQFPDFMQFFKLSKLDIRGCPNLRLLPPCPNVEDVSLLRMNENVSVLNMVLATTSSAPSCSSSSSGFGGSGVKSRDLLVDDAEQLMSLPTHCPHQLTLICFNGDRKLESTKRVGDVFATLSSSLRTLTFWECDNLKSIAKGLEHLTALEELEFATCEELDISGSEEAGDEEEEEGMPWKALNTSLRSLKLWHLPKLVVLPSGLQHLANLRSLRLSFNDELVEVPEWMSCLCSLEYLELFDCPKLTCLPEALSKLTSLNHLKIIKCPGLTIRCKGPNGSEWPKIRHIPLLTVRD